MVTKVKKNKKKRVASNVIDEKRCQLKRFIRDVEREEPIDDEILKIMLSYNPVC